MSSVLLLDTHTHHYSDHKHSDGAVQSRLFQDLARWAGQDAERVSQTGRDLRCGSENHPPADPTAQPEPCKGFGAPPDMQPTLLMIWDFCQTYR